jgi:bleomycin hydrolase
MFIVRKIYEQKMRNFILRQGKANFSQGALAHDQIAAAAEFGLVPESAYPGKKGTVHNHEELEKVLQAMAQVYAASNPGSISGNWLEATQRVLDAYLGVVPESFDFQGKRYTPKQFAEFMGFDAKKYVSLTSFSHHPFYQWFVLEVPDNFSNGSFANLPLDEMMAAVEYAINNNYSVTWDADVSNKGFAAGKGLALLPEKPWSEYSSDEAKKIWEEPAASMVVTQEKRQEEFMKLNTQDDHLMHLTGMVKDQKGGKYFVIKNSWGEISDLKGHVYVSEAYARLNTISVLLPIEALSKATREKLGLK